MLNFGVQIDPLVILVSLVREIEYKPTLITVAGQTRVAKGFERVQKRLLLNPAGEVGMTSPSPKFASSSPDCSPDPKTDLNNT